MDKAYKFKTNDEGFILPLVLIVTLILGAGLMASTTRAWLGLTGAVRQSQARSAREVAEAGLSQLIEALNRNHAHLLVIDDENWSNPPLFSAICANASTGVPATTGTIGSNGKYTLENYNFNGSPFYGGKADLRMRGEILKSDNSTAAAAIVEQTVEIKAKSCNTSFDEPTTTSGFPGLLAQNVDMGGNDLRGRLSGNLLCLQSVDNIPNNCSVRAAHHSIATANLTRSAWLVAIRNKPKWMEKFISAQSTCQLYRYRPTL